MKHNRGFTLLEVLAAVAITGMALAVILQLFSANLRGLAASDEYLAASIAAEEKMREVISKGDFSPQTWSETTREGYSVEYSVSPAFTERSDGLLVELHEITLTLRYTGGSKERAITLRTMRAAPRSL